MRPRLPRVDEEATMTRRDIEFDAEGVTLHGWFYPAQGATGSAPTVVMAHGFSAVKDIYLDSFADPGPGGLRCGVPRDVGRGPAGPFPGQGTGHGARGGRGSAG